MGSTTEELAAPRAKETREEGLRHAAASELAVTAVRALVQPDESLMMIII